MTHDSIVQAEEEVAIKIYMCARLCVTVFGSLLLELLYSVHKGW